MNEKISTEIIHKEIDLIESCISRMANNSFLLKGWLISLVGIILAIVLKQSNILIPCVILIFIIIAFWYLDAFFLMTERKYRKLYEWVLQERPKGNKKYLYDLNSDRFSCQVGSIGNVMRSKTLRVFYGIPLFLIILLMILKIFSLSCKLKLIF